MQISRQTKLVVGMVAFVVVVVVLGSIVFDISIERAILLAPVLVVSVLVLAGLALFWGRVAISQIRGTDQPEHSPFAQPGGKQPHRRDGGSADA